MHNNQRQLNERRMGRQSLLNGIHNFFILYFERSNIHGFSYFSLRYLQIFEKWVKKTIQKKKSENHFVLYVGLQRLFWLVLVIVSFSVTIILSLQSLERYETKSTGTAKWKLWFCSEWKVVKGIFLCFSLFPIVHGEQLYLWKGIIITGIPPFRRSLYVQLLSESMNLCLTSIAIEIKFLDRTKMNFTRSLSPWQMQHMNHCISSTHRKVLR